MRRIAIAALSAAVLMVGGCEPTRGTIMESPAARPLRLRTPDAEYRIPRSEIAKVRPGFDTAALERLLGMIQPEQRDAILADFQRPKPGEAVTETVFFGDPELQQVLEEVWAPVWDRVPQEVLERDQSDRPGKAIARARREARRPTNP